MISRLSIHSIRFSFKGFNETNFYRLCYFSSQPSTDKSDSSHQQIGNNKYKRPKEIENTETVVVTKQNLPQSPWKMRFLVMLIRDAWMPDALAQLKFSPKLRSDDIAKIVKRACVLARMQYDAIPEELRVKEVLITKGFARKRIRIMGKGRTGIGYKRSSHIRIVIEKINFQSMINKQKSLNQRLKWIKRKALAEEKKLKEKVPLTASSS